MKQFLYLDTDIVNSIIAQEEKGLVQNYSKDDEENKTKSTQFQAEGEGSGKTEGSLLKLAKAEANLTMKIGIEKDFSSGTTTHEIISKVLHDAAFDVAYEYIHPHIIESGNNSSDNYGDYVEIKRAFDFVDFAYLENIFSDGGIIEYIKKSSREDIETRFGQATEKMNRDQLRNSGKQIKAEMKKLVEISDKQYNDVHDIIAAFRQLVPYTRMLISYDGYLIPLDDKYFRVNPVSLGFRYGGEITCVGMVTNIIGADTDPEDSKNIFASLQFTVNDALRKILPTREENLCVIHPIAVFYGN